MYYYDYQKHFKNMTQRLSLEHMFWILKYPSSFQGCLQMCHCVKLTKQKGITNCRNNGTA